MCFSFMIPFLNDHHKTEVYADEAVSVFNYNSRYYLETLQSVNNITTISNDVFKFTLITDTSDVFTYDSGKTYYGFDLNLQLAELSNNTLINRLFTFSRNGVVQSFPMSLNRPNDNLHDFIFDVYYQTTSNNLHFRIGMFVSYPTSSDVDGVFKFDSLQYRLLHPWLPNGDVDYDNYGDRLFTEVADSQGLNTYNNRYISQYIFMSSGEPCLVFEFCTYYLNSQKPSSYIYFLNNYDETIYNSGYSAGYDVGMAQAGSNNYNAGYQYGYNVGKGVGYSSGYSDGTDDAGRYTFTGLISACIDAPIHYFTSLFNFELLGVNLQSFFTGLFTLCVIVTIIRLCLGG